MGSFGCYWIFVFVHELFYRSLQAIEWYELKIFWLYELPGAQFTSSNFFILQIVAQWNPERFLLIESKTYTIHRFRLGTLVEHQNSRYILL